jgi:hypothetical protein
MNPGVLDEWEALCTLSDTENSMEKFEEEKIVGKIEKAAATPQIPRPKVNAPPSGHPPPPCPTFQTLKLLHHWHLQQNLHVKNGYSLPKMSKDMIEKVMARRMPTLKSLLLHFHSHPSQQLVSTTAIEGQTGVCDPTQMGSVFGDKSATLNRLRENYVVLLQPTRPSCS